MTDSEKLSTKLQQIRQLINIDSLYAKDFELKDIQKYFQINRIAYYLFHSREGFAHMGLSDTDNFQKKDLERHLELISTYINDKEDFKILELAAGKLINLKRLSDKFNKCDFYALDLPNGQTPHKSRNKRIKLNYGDYHNLNEFSEEYFDLVFIIEGLCYSNKKEIVAKEINRVLKPGGHFIVFDAYLGKDINRLSANEKSAKMLIEKGMRVNNFEEYDSFRKKITGAGFWIIDEMDCTKQILPTVKRFETLASHLFKHIKMGKIVLKILPTVITGNALSGYLMPQVIDLGIAKYYFTAFEKN
jgi:arsenite methyltransferase